MGDGKKNEVCNTDLTKAFNIHALGTWHFCQSARFSRPATKERQRHHCCDLNTPLFIFSFNQKTKLNTLKTDGKCWGIRCRQMLKRLRSIRNSLNTSICTHQYVLDFSEMQSGGIYQVWSRWIVMLSWSKSCWFSISGMLNSRGGNPFLNLKETVTSSKNGRDCRSSEVVTNSIYHLLWLSHRIALSTCSMTLFAANVQLRSKLLKSELPGVESLDISFQWNFSY